MNMFYGDIPAKVKMVVVQKASESSLWPAQKAEGAAS
jgi:hypothetical protein